MKHFTQKHLVQDVTYWAPGIQNVYGHVAQAVPILIRGRWEDKVEQIRRTSGEEVTSTAVVYVDRDVVVSGFLALGDLTDQSAPPTTAREIQMYSTIPDLRNLGTERKAYL